MERRSGRTFGRALTPLILGLCLAAVSHPDVAGLIVRDGGRRLSWRRLSELALDHLILAGTGLAIIGLLGVGLGILATRPFAREWRGPIDSVAALAQGVPPVVVVALALPVLGFGGPPTLLALVCYGIMPTLRSTIGALESVSADAKDAAIALGLTPGQLLRQVELPLASKGILDALRTALVLAVATAAVGALAGASTLGTPIVAGLQNQNLVAMLQGAAATAAMAFLGDAVIVGIAGWIDRHPTPSLRVERSNPGR